MPLTYGGGSRAWDPAAKAVVFPAMDGKNPVRCMVTTEALALHFGMAKAEELDALRAFDRARMVIEEKAASPGVQSGINSLIDKKRLDIARRQFRGEQLYAVVKMRLVFTNDMPRTT